MDFKDVRDRAIKAAKSQIKVSYENEEHILIQAINAFNETTKSYNLVCERLSEWYGIYFPEIKLASHKELAELAISMCSLEGPSQEGISKVVQEQQRAESIYRKAQSTMGRKITDGERGAMLAFAVLARSMDSTLSEMDAYIKAAAGRILPNTTYLTDDKIAAELLSKAGSMERLALMPASTVQLLGAEKALFKHIKFGNRPPKYGILFKLPDVTNAPRDKKGRIARIYATKIGIALKADFFSKRFIAEKLKEDLKKSMERINATESKPKPQQPFREGQFQGRRFGHGPRRNENRFGNKFGSRGRRPSFGKPTK